MTVRIEVCRQELPLGALNETQTDTALPRLSAPLQGLVEFAEQTASVTERAPLPDYAFSNDELASYYAALKLRKVSPDFMLASNRVAVLIGESALAAALGEEMLPEETIIMLDVNKMHSAYMQHYIEALRTRSSPLEWRNTVLGEHEQANDQPNASAATLLESQIREWRASGYTHALTNQEAYMRAQSEARKKTIITWSGDVTNRDHMTLLGNALKGRDAYITFLNLSNVMPTNDTLHTAAAFALPLENLPLTPSTPILTSSLRQKEDDSIIVEATGPFWGLQNLRLHGGNTNTLSKRTLGAAVDRQYHYNQPEPYLSPSLIRAIEQLFRH
ncbi:hypothetical protein JNM87_06435 [Candidatus Saccharibacteria bacterium]|nr:hypothetical protein [Candidatus Saccharibacteria bacterium]